MDHPAAYLEPASSCEARAEPAPRTPTQCPGPSPAARRIDWRSTSPPRTIEERRGATSIELCPLLEPRDHWTPIQHDIEWTSEGTEEFLGHEAATTLRSKSPDRCLVQTPRTSLEPVDGNQARADRRTTRSKQTRTGKEGVAARLYLLTTGGLIGVMRRQIFGFSGMREGRGLPLGESRTQMRRQVRGPRRSSLL